jgi:uncharacterized protein
MFGVRAYPAALIAAALLLPGAAAPVASAAAAAPVRKIAVTVESKAGPRVFHVEVARTAEQQERGLMFRTNIPADGGMIFIPYPAKGPPREASFWMKNTPSPLDIIFIRADGTIAYIGENTIPFSQAPVESGEPVAAILEVPGGRTAELGIVPGDRVAWPRLPATPAVAGGAPAG